jgi:hypothetical protein
LLFVPAAVPFTFHWNTGFVPPCTGVAEKFTVVPVQILVVLAEMAIVGVTCVPVVIMMTFEVAVALVTQAAFEASSQDTWSPLFNRPLYVSLLVPTPAPFTFHWYTGEGPPLEATAVKVAIAPWQIVVDRVLIEIVGVTAAFTAMVIVFEFALGVVTQLSLEVSSQLTWSALFNVVVV